MKKTPAARIHPTIQGRCDICNHHKAKYDAKTKHGPWANMCEDCFKLNGIKLGKGFGKEIGENHELLDTI